MPGSRADVSVGHPAPGLHEPRIGTVTAFAVSGAAGLLAALLSVPGAFLLWIGVSVAVGRGDPTWNDGEEVWATGIGLLLTGIVSLAIHHSARTVSVRVRRSVRTIVACLWVVPTVAIHLLFAANALS